MKKIKFKATIFNIILILITSPAHAGELSSELLERLHNAHHKEQLSVIIRMADQADLKASTQRIIGRNKALCSRNVISRNSICDNYFGIHLRHSPDNLIHLNDFVNNSVNIYSYNSDNIWNSTKPLTYVYRRKYKNHIGNCWSCIASITLLSTIRR